jgi:AbrB family looped-hinge helix DNA binding protein
MVQIDITRMSSKGQVVIPVEMRDDLKEGEKLVVFKEGSQIILKKADDFDENLKEDLEFARRTGEAWKEYEKGKFETMEFDDFLKVVNKW